jgi:hypothetical protein
LRRKVHRELSYPHVLNAVGGKRYGLLPLLFLAFSTHFIKEVLFTVTSLSTKKKKKTLFLKKRPKYLSRTVVGEGE